MTPSPRPRLAAMSANRVTVATSSAMGFSTSALLPDARTRSAVGARLTLQAGDLRQIREIKAGLSYLSANDLRVHFGLGALTKADSLEIRWPSGLVERIENIRADQVLKVEEGKAPKAGGK